MIFQINFVNRNGISIATIYFHYQITSEIAQNDISNQICELKWYFDRNNYFSLSNSNSCTFLCLGVPILIILDKMKRGNSNTKLLLIKNIDSCMVWVWCINMNDRGLLFRSHQSNLYGLPKVDVINLFPWSRGSQKAIHA